MVEFPPLPRRCNINSMTKAELLIYRATQAVEAEGADPVLTDISMLLLQARSKLADWVDEVKIKQEAQKGLDSGESVDYDIDAIEQEVESEQSNPG